MVKKYALLLCLILFAINSTTNAQSDSIWDVTDYSLYPAEARFFGEYPQQDTNLNFPKFSWDKIPRWVAVRNADRYTTAQINAMADNYQIVMFEKANKQGFPAIEEGILDASHRVKAVNPDIKTLFYWNTRLGYGGYAADAEYLANEWEWTQHTFDTDGNEILFLHKDYIYWYNHEVEGMRNWWLDVALGMARQDDIDGIFLDKSFGDTPFLYDEAGGPIDNYTDMLIRLNDSIPQNKLIIGNTLRNERDNGNRAMMEIEDGSYMERWAFFNRAYTQTQTEAEAIVVSIQLMREALLKGKIITMQTGPGYTTDETEPATREERMIFMQDHVHFPLAVFLIIAEKNAYFSYNMGVNAISSSLDVWDASFIKEFGYYLGEPLGEPTKNGFVYSRSYDNLDVTVNVSTKKTTFKWKNKISATQTLPTLEEGNSWYLNYYPLEFNAPYQGSHSGTYTTSEATPSTKVNPSTLVSKFIRASGNEASVKFRLPGNLGDSKTAFFKVRVYAPSADSSGTDTLRLILRKDGNEATQLSSSHEVTEYNKWIEYSFDLAEDTFKEEYYNDICLYFTSADAADSAEGRVYYIDAFQGPKKPYIVKFLIRDILNSSLLQGISVITAQREKKTDVLGETDFYLAEGSQSIKITHPDYVELVYSFDADKDTLIELFLTPDEKSVVFKMVSENNNPLANISGVVGEIEITTGLNGTAIFNLIKGPYEFSFSHPDYFTSTFSFEVKNDTSLQLELISNKADIKFRIYAENKGLYNVAVKLEDSLLTSNPTGIVFFRNLKRFEQYSWSAYKEGYENISGTIDLQNDTTVNVTMILTGLEEVHGVRGLKIYPNPVHSELIIESLDMPGRVEILDLRGELISRMLVNDKKAILDISGYPTGVYIARVFRDGQGTVNVKFIKSE